MDWKDVGLLAIIGLPVSALLVGPFVWWYEAPEALAQGLSITERLVSSGAGVLAMWALAMLPVVAYKAG